MNSRLRQSKSHQETLGPRCSKKRKVKKSAKILVLLCACFMFFFLGQTCAGIVQSVTSFFTGTEPSITQKLTNIADAFEETESKVAEKEKTDPWNLLLINSSNPLPPDFQVKLKKFDDEEEGEHYVDERIHSDLLEMYEGAQGDGVYLQINSAYRNAKEQQHIIDKRVKKLMDQGFSYQEAQEMVLEVVALPGISEHEAGLAVDFGVGKGNKSWDSVYEWLKKNSYKYGFILRYPQEKEELTGVAYEHWHYRYVGKEVAKEIKDKGICLEEYLENR